MRRSRLVVIGTLMLVLVAATATLVITRTGGVPAPPVGAAAPLAGSDTPGCRIVTPDPPGARESRLPVRPLCALPPDVAAVVSAIQRGGPFSYPKDGSTFRNAERLLPARAIGYYREYTVPTPGSPDRGARRVVAGTAGEVYYTDDHYVSFVVVDVAATGSG